MKTYQLGAFALILFALLLPNLREAYSASPADLTVGPPVVVARDLPARVIIPSIYLDAPIQPMGINYKGELDVPNGKTGNVGWYKDGTSPGEVGSAVFDAHVFAAFKKLAYVKPGSDVYVVTTSGKRLHFIVEDAKTYALKNLSPQTLYGLNDKERLNLITCAGKLTADRSTYDHRLVVYTSLVDIS